MKKVIIRTIWITLGVVLILGISVFGILSFCAPATMMNFSGTLGLTGISGDYAYQEYLQSGDISCLALSFETAAVEGRDQIAETRFNAFYNHEKFSEYCAQQDQKSVAGAPKIVYRSYVCGLSAEVKYRLCETEEDRAEVCEFAVRETAPDFPSGNPVYFLANAAAEKKDEVFCSELSDILKRTSKFSALRAESNLPEDEKSDGYTLLMKTIEMLDGINS